MTIVLFECWQEVRAVSVPLPGRTRFRRCLEREAVYKSCDIFIWVRLVPVVANTNVFLLTVAGKSFLPPEALWLQTCCVRLHTEKPCDFDQLLFLLSGMVSRSLCACRDLRSVAKRMRNWVEVQCGQAPPTRCWCRAAQTCETEA